MLLELQTWPKVESYLKTKKHIIIPIGSVEQHGPTGLIGTDFLTAKDVAQGVGEKTNTLVAPSLNYGMAAHHMGFPGTATLRPKTLMSVIRDVVLSFYQHGFRKIIFINGHGGNIPTLQSAFCEIKYNETYRDLILENYNWWQMPPIKEYEEEHFEDESGFHATISEVSLTQYFQEEAFKDIPKTQFQVDRPKTPFPMTGEEMRSFYPDGRMASNPGRATKEHGKILFDLAVNYISKNISKKP